MTDPLRGWHLDKRVPLAIIFAIAMQTVGLVVWATRLDARVSALEAQAMTEQADRLADRQAGARRDLDIRTLQTQSANIDQSLRDLSGDIREMNRKLDRLFEAGATRPDP